MRCPEYKLDLSFGRWLCVMWNLHRPRLAWSIRILYKGQAQGPWMHCYSGDAIENTRQAATECGDELEVKRVLTTKARILGLPEHPGW